MSSMAVVGERGGGHRAEWPELDDEQEESPPASPMDSPEARKLHRRLMEWLLLEREKQATNRLEMAIDCDFYDNEQWDAEDAAEVSARCQIPLVYNEIAPMVDWLIGTERRTKADWSVLPRAEDDVAIADIKTNVLKYISDVNRVPFARSQAFGDAIKSGLGWLDDGVQDDPTKEVLYSKREDWRRVLYDSSSYELDLSDARYVFRWRWVDEDVALAMFPERKEAILRAIEDQGAYDSDSDADEWYLGSRVASFSSDNLSGSTLIRSGSGFVADRRRRRVKLIEAQYREPVSVRVATSGPLRGIILPDDHKYPAEDETARVMMRVHFAVFTEADMLSYGPSQLRHNRFSLTPLWCYRRGRDRQPYGVIRRVRDIARDLNKRASKAQFLLSTNQIIADEGAVADWDEARDEVDRPDGTIVKRPGKEFTIRRDTDAATGQINMMTLAAQSIQKIGGVNNENLGRQTNAVSGAAIEARQNQGAVGTTEPFDNLRYAIQVQGEKQLSLSEQFYTEAKVVRLTGANGKIDWLKINQPELQPDGSVRYLNDITESLADFVVSDQDYAGTLRQVMFESLNQLATRLPPDVSLRILTIAMEFSDMPNKDAVAEAIRRVTGERDESKEPSEEDVARQQEQERVADQQRELASIAVEEARATVREINAKAAKIEVEAAAQGAGEKDALGQSLMQVRGQAMDQVDALTEELRKAHAELANRSAQIARDAEVKLEAAQIDADARVKVAEIQQANSNVLQQLMDRLSAIEKSVSGKKRSGNGQVKSDAGHGA